MSQLTGPPPIVRRAAGRAPSDPDRSGVPPAAHSHASSPPVFPRRPLQRLLDEPGVTVVRHASRPAGDMDTLLLARQAAEGPRLAVKVASTSAAEAEIEREGRMLVEMRRLELGRLRDTVPRFVQICDQDGRTALVASALPGRSLTGAFCRALAWSHRRCRLAELQTAGAWLARFQDATERGSGAVDMLPSDQIGHLAQRYQQSAEASDDLRAVTERARAVQDVLSRYEAPRSAVHGNFRTAQVLVDEPGGGVTGVLGWRRAAVRGEPLRDIARLAVTHTAHPGLHGAVPGGAVLVGRSQCAQHARRFIEDGLRRLGLPETLWYPVAWAAAASLLAETDPLLEPRAAAAATRLLARTAHPGEAL